jgi:hypothetical protein
VFVSLLQELKSHHMATPSPPHTMCAGSGSPCEGLCVIVCWLV